MKVKVAYGTEVFEVPNCSKAMLVSKFKKLVEKATDVQPKFQQLIFGGKIFNDKNDLCDYKIEDGYKIMLLLLKSYYFSVNKKKYDMTF